MSKKKTKAFEVGDLYAIPLKSGGYAYGLVCVGRDFAFFNQRVNEPVMPARAQDIQLAFRVPVAKDAPATGGWLHIGQEVPEGEFAEPGKYLHKPVGSTECYIYSAGQEAPADIDTCRHLEVLSTWFSFHVEERLEDSLAGRENKYVAAIKRQLGI